MVCCACNDFDLIWMNFVCFKNLAQLRGRRSLDWQDSKSSTDTGACVQHAYVQCVTVCMCVCCCYFFLLYPEIVRDSHPAEFLITSVAIEQCFYRWDRVFFVLCMCRRTHGDIHARSWANGQPNTHWLLIVSCYAAEWQLMVVALKET